MIHSPEEPSQSKDEGVYRQMSLCKTASTSSSIGLHPPNPLVTMSICFDWDRTPHKIIGILLILVLHLPFRIWRDIGQ
jgi:hypothetical protein